MKKNLILIVFLACSTIMLSQEKDSLVIGEWKVISIDTENYYYDSTTDSFSWSKGFEKMLPKLIKDYGYKNSEEFAESTKKAMICDKFIFEENGVYLRKCNAQILREGNYSIKSSKKIIYFKDKEKPEYSMKYSIKKGLLYLTIILNDSAKLKPTKFILQKTTTS
ncbi:MAG TPA: hypothetical protein VIV55_09650 [Flavobacterium sp.]